MGVTYLTVSVTKPAFSNGSGASFGSGLSSLLGNKRDSFKLLAASSSSKDQLHTLVEEEEEEEELVSQAAVLHKDETSALPPVDMDKSNIASDDSGTPSNLPMEQEEDVEFSVGEDHPIQPLAPKPRPAALSLRPLSLTPENLVSLQGLPTPSWTPGPRSGLRRLSLSPVPPGEDAENGFSTTPTPAPRRPPLTLNLSNINENPTLPSDECRSQRRSSITYKPPSHGVMTSLAGLPTPEMTPTFKSRRCSITESVHSTQSEDEFFPGGSSQIRPLSVSEQHFLVKSHKALLSRITDLERALTNRRRASSAFARSETGGSRPTSILSDASSSDTGGEPSDEMLRLIADLKAERDELKRDVDGWRTRVGDMEKQTVMLTNRVEAERRDAWIARSRAGLLEVEKSTLEKKVEINGKVIEDLNDENQTLKMVKEDLARESEGLKHKLQEVEERLKATQADLEKERELRNLQEKESLATAAVHARPRSSYGRNAGTAFASTDSIASSTTEVEAESSDDCEARFKFMLKAVQEEDESNGFVEEDNGLASYEDEEESDESFRSSSFDSLDEDTTTPIQCSTPSTPELHEAFSTPLDTQASSPSRLKTWTFPRRTGSESLPSHNKQDSVDRFFGCLDGETNSEAGSTPCSPSQYSFEKSKSLFASALRDIDDDESPFFLPQGVGIIVEENHLDVVLEEDEVASNDELDERMFGEMGGIRITLSPPQPEDDRLVLEPPQLVVQTIKRPVEDPPQLPMLNFGNDGNDDGFNFGRPVEQTHLPQKKQGHTPVTDVVSTHSIVSTPAVATVLPAAGVPPSVVQTPPSCIPRSTSPSAIPRFSPPKSTTPMEPSPMVVAPPASSPYITPPSKRGGAVPSFIPQPVSSPSPIRVLPPSGKLKTTATYSIRQTQKKPLMSNTAGNGKGKNANGSNPTSQNVIRTSC